MKRLDELVSDFITKGATPTTTGHDWAESGIPFLRSECVSADGFEPNGIRYITPAANTQLARSVVRSGDVLISITGNVGRVVRYPDSMPPGNINQHIARVRIERDDVLPDFVVYQLLTPEQQERFGSIHVGAAYPLLSLKQIRETEVRLPPLPEQQRIVGKLDAAFAALAEAQAHVERSRANAGELFESYLNGVFTEEKRDWPERKLGELTERITKGSSPKWQGISYVDEPGVLFVTSENVGEFRLLLDAPKYVEERFNAKDRKSILQKGDVLTNIVGASIGRTAIYDIDTVANINQAVCLIRCLPDVLSNAYLTYLLNSPFFKAILHENEVDNARANLSLGFFSTLAIPVPSMKEQKAVVAKMDRFREEYLKLETTYQQKQTELAGLKKAVLGAAFRGEL